MLDEKLKIFFTVLQNGFADGRIQDIAVFFVFPLVVYTPVGVTLIRNTQEFGVMTSQYRDAIAAMKVAKTNIQVKDIDQTCNHRLRATVRFTPMDTEGRVLTSSLIRYFLMENGESFLVEMIEYLELPIPVSEVERIVH